ncbi:MAG: hypothetical protein M3463_10410 [Verrucomicrobiota bacterium]|nr:hypothetical protein [Verrucomicrobiota bacterium]
MPSLGESVLRGTLGFTLLSVAGFAPWAVAGRWFYRAIGEAGLYVVCAGVFIALSGPLLHRLIIGPGSLLRFYKLFALAFGAYAIAWIAGWMLVRDHAGSLTGLLAGTVLMGWILARAFDAGGATLKVVATLFLLNTIGYFIGGWLEGVAEAIGKPTGVMLAKLLWGVCYGMGLGAGLGLAFHFCQAPARALLAASRQSAGTVAQ